LHFVTAVLATAHTLPVVGGFGSTPDAIRPPRGYTLVEFAQLTQTSLFGPTHLDIDSLLNTTSITLLHRIRSADSVAWDRFVDLYTPLIFRWARSRGLDSNDASDLTQDIFTTLVQKLPDFRYDQAKSFRGWLKTITLNRCSDLFRKRKLNANAHATEQVQDVADEVSDVEFLTEQEYNEFVATRALQLMKNEFESTTWQACWQSITTDLTALEIAEKLGISVNAVYLAKSRVLRRLRQQLAGLLD